MFLESSTGRWAVLQLPCCPSKQGERSENILQNLFHNLTPQTVLHIRTVFLQQRERAASAQFSDGSQDTKAKILHRLSKMTPSEQEKKNAE